MPLKSKHSFYSSPLSTQVIRFLLFSSFAVRILSVLKILSLGQELNSNCCPNDNCLRMEGVFLWYIGDLGGQVWVFSDRLFICHGAHVLGTRAVLLFGCVWLLCECCFLAVVCVVACECVLWLLGMLCCLFVLLFY
jgi:hypothetical protein